jgi:anti-sigma regulatory factor (Ser/Thr protein kinase)
MFTDGITEARDRRGRVFGQNGITAAVIGANRESPEAVADAVLAAALQHGGLDQPEDDQALLVIQIGTPAQVLADGLPTLSQVEIGPGVLAFELTNASDSGQYLGSLRNALMTWAAPHLPPERRRQEVWSALVEAIQNALRYGCGPGEVIGIEFRPSVPFPGVEIVVSQPKRWEDWDISLGARRPSQELTPRGVGTLTMLRLASEVTVSDQGRRVHLRFFSGGPAPGRRLADGDMSADLRLRSPEDLNIRIKMHDDEHGTQGLVAHLINDRTANLSNCVIVVRDAKSFDARKQAYRESFGMRPTRVALYGAVLAGDQTTDSWLVRVVDDHLEVGDGRGAGVLVWPKGDPVETEIWLLTLSIEAGGLDTWTFDLRVVWSRGSNVLQVYPLETP